MICTLDLVAAYITRLDSLLSVSLDLYRRVDAPALDYWTNQHSISAVSGIAQAPQDMLAPVPV
jgi:hypothetical protein